MKKTIFAAFALMLSLYVSGQEYLGEKYPISELDIVLDDGCVSINLENDKDILCFFTDDGKQHNLSGYVRYRPYSKKRDVSYCNNSALLFDAKSKTLLLGLRKITHFAYRVKG
jgi:hypothetical protein